MSINIKQAFDVIVVGSGITGGWAAKEFCEKGFNTLVIERGRNIEHRGPEYKDMQAPWELQNRDLGTEKYDEEGRYQLFKEKFGKYRSEFMHFFADEKEHPYSHPDDKPFMWTRGYQLGGRSLTWARQVYRWGRTDFESNAKDGHGVPWPIGYDDLAPWYEYVERFIGVSGNEDGLDSVPDCVSQKAFEMSCAEKFVSDNIAKSYKDRRLISARAANLTEPTPEQRSLGRGKCQARAYCKRGCTFGAYFSSLSATLPAAKATGNLSIVTDAIASHVDYDQSSGKASGVTVIDANTKKKSQYKARVVFLCASALGSVQIMLNSKSDTFPNGIANSSDALGRYIMDHFTGVRASATVPGLDDKYSFGRRPIGTYIPNFRQQKAADVNFVRGYGFQTSASQRSNTGNSANRAGIGAVTKAQANQPSDWVIRAFMYGEILPYYNNRATLHPTKTDKWGMPQLHIDAKVGENERNMTDQAAKDIEEMLDAGGCTNIKVNKVSRSTHISVGARTHEMGGACMGSNPKTSVLNAWSQAHDVPNLFVTDGAAMSSSATQNPSLTYMAITARAADYAAKLLKAGTL
ncbi:GMC oxidoreductase [Glaciecola sp. SC05]|uniref:GMC oxidoreductase n=1 Tax=Glaciecola sp. SC05 TaxID=1987355 RepID=UPI003528552C